MIEPPPGVQPLSGESLHPRSAVTSDNARLDVRADGFWDCPRQSAFFDVRIFNPTAQSCRNQSLPACYCRHEREKRRPALHVWGQSYSDWTWVFYSLSFFHFWWNGALSIYSFLQETRLPPINEEECSLWLSHVLDPLQDLLCPHLFGYSLSPWHSLLPYPSVTRFWSCTCSAELPWLPDCCI